METKLKLKGMHCDACRRLVEKRLRTISGVSDVAAEVETGDVRVFADRVVSSDEVKMKLEGTGYSVV